MKKDSRKYYAAYEERYKTAHANGVSWSSDVNTPIVMEVIGRYKIRREHKLLEIGCGEGRDSRTVLDHGFPLMATDISEEAIAYCRQQMPRYEKHFSVLDCLSARLDEPFDFIFAIAVVHMLVLDEDRDGFYRFIRSHLTAEQVFAQLRETYPTVVLAPVYKYLKSQGDFGILVTPDHPTPLTTRAHSNAPVPFIIYRSDVAPIAPAENYCEAAAKKNAVVLNEGYMAISRMILAGKPFL